MKVILFLVVIVFIIGMVAFGHNPIQEAREARAKNKVTSGDPVADAIFEYEKKAHGGKGMSDYNNNRNAPVYNANQGFNRGYNNYNNRNSYSPNQPAAPANNNNPAPNYYTPPQNSYYPPPANAQPQSNASPYSRSGLELASGQPVSFSGINVFTTDTQGKTIPMPDGDYPIANSTHTLLVRHGIKMMTFD